MKRALIVIASVGILAVTVAMESASAQVTRPSNAPPPYAGIAQNHGWDGLGAPRTMNSAPSFPAGNNQFWNWKRW
jgi:hypothetical protein